MQWLRFAVLLCVVTVLQAGLLENFNIRPDLLLILLVFFAVYSDTSNAIITSFIIGFAADIIVMTSAVGPKTLSFGLCGTLLAYLHRVIAIRKMTYQALAILLTGLLVGIAAYSLAFLRGQQTTPKLSSVLVAVPLFSAVVGPFLFLPFAWWMRIKTQRFSRY
ncbi:MAG: rod shape-determining protein MreD [Planctomycetota bacterium]